MRDLPCAARSDDVEWTARVSGVCGALLAGGTSSRFGEDKFLFVYDGEALGLRAAKALAAVATAGCWLQGGTRAHAALTGLPIRTGRREGSGPLGALTDALESCDAEVLVSLPCDMPGIRSEDLARLVASVNADVDVAVAFADSRHHWLVAAWSVRCRQSLIDAFEAGERAVHRALASMRVADVAFDTESLTNLNRRPA